MIFLKKYLKNKIVLFFLRCKIFLVYEHAINKNQLFNQMMIDKYFMENNQIIIY